MTNNQPTLCFILVNNPDLGLPPSESITIFEDEEGQLRIPESEKRTFEKMLEKAVEHLNDKYHQGAIVAVRVERGDWHQAFHYSIRQRIARGEVRRRSSSAREVQP